MDILMASQDIIDGVPTKWDIILNNGVGISLSGDAEKKQRAVVAAYQQKGTVPGIEDTGTDWVGYMTGIKNARELDAEIRNNMLSFTGVAKFIPYYFIKNNSLRLTIQEGAPNVN